MDAELNVTNRGVVEVTPDEFGTVRISWPDGTVTELRRAAEGPDLIRLRTYAGDGSIARLLIQENYGRPNGQGKLITGLQIERIEQAALVRSAGWDGTVRRMVADHFGSLEACAEHYTIDVSDIEETARPRAMKIWSRIVERFGGTWNVADQVLGLQLRQPAPDPMRAL